MYIPRATQPLLQKLEKTFPAVLVVGPRQCGKSTLLQHNYPQARYVTFDDPFEVLKAQAGPLDYLTQFQGQVILDEIQYVPELFRALKIVIDRDRRNGRFLLTGSQVFELSQWGTESLAGRLGILELGPLSGQEIEQAAGPQALKSHLARGGYPEIWGRQADPSLWFPAYVSTYLSRDLRQLSQVADLSAFSRFLRALAFRTGSLLNYADLARDVGAAPNTIKHWVSLLVTSGLGSLVEGYSTNPTLRLVKSPKFYFCDSGLLLHLMGFSQLDEAEQTGHLGPLWETWCHTQLRLWLTQQGEGHRPLHYWRTKEGKEVDFLVDYQGLTAVECKARALPEAKDAAGLKALRGFFKDQPLRCGLLTLAPGFLPRLPEGPYFVDNGLHWDHVFSLPATPRPEGPAKIPSGTDGARPPVPPRGNPG